jgi:hypothetical protein
VVDTANRIPALKKAAEDLCRSIEVPADDVHQLASAVEFVLEGLHVNDRLSKYRFRERTFYKQ